MRRDETLVSVIILWLLRLSMTGFLETKMMMADFRQGGMMACIRE